jgi:hypothetical protein
MRRPPEPPQALRGYVLWKPRARLMLSPKSEFPPSTTGSPGSSRPASSRMVGSLASPAKIINRTLRGAESLSTN